MAIQLEREREKIEEDSLEVNGIIEIVCQQRGRGGGSRCLSRLNYAFSLLYEGKLREFHDWPENCYTPTDHGLICEVDRRQNSIHTFR